MPRSEPSCCCHEGEFRSVSSSRENTFSIWADESSSATWKSFFPHLRLIADHTSVIPHTAREHIRSNKSSSTPKQSSLRDEELFTSSIQSKKKRNVCSRTTGLVVVEVMWARDSKPDTESSCFRRLSRSESIAVFNAILTAFSRGASRSQALTISVSDQPNRRSNRWETRARSASGGSSERENGSTYRVSSEWEAADVQLSSLTSSPTQGRSTFDTDKRVRLCERVIKS